MEKNLCFVLDGKNVYMEKCLIEDEIPIFFICVNDESEYYLVLCTDIDTTEYIVVSVSESQLHSMLFGSLTMREIFMEQDFYWDVISEDGTIECDIVQKKSIGEIAEEDLPNEGAYFTLFCEDLREYADKIREDIQRKWFDSSPEFTYDILKSTESESDTFIQNATPISISICKRSISIIDIIEYEMDFCTSHKIVYGKERRDSEKMTSVDGSDIITQKVCIKPSENDNSILSAA